MRATGLGRMLSDGSVRPSLLRRQATLLAGWVALPARPAKVARESCPSAVARLVPHPCAISATMALVATPKQVAYFPTTSAIVSGVTHGLMHQVQGVRVQFSQPQRFCVCDSLHRCNPVVGIHVCTPDKHFKAKCLCQCPHLHAGAMMDAIQHVRHSNTAVSLLQSTSNPCGSSSGKRMPRRTKNRRCSSSSAGWSGMQAMLMSAALGPSNCWIRNSNACTYVSAAFRTLHSG